MIQITKGNKGKEKWNLRLDLYFFLINLSVFVGVSIIAACISAVLYHFAHHYLSLPEAVYDVIISIVLGGVVTSILSKRIFIPIRNLNQAMEKVAGGDFTVQLNENHSLTEIQELYHNFNLMVKGLASTEVLQMDFVSNVSHEFKTPISAIEGYATLLQGDPNLTKDQEEYAEKILNNSSRLSGLVSNILLLSKIESGSIQTVTTEFALDEQLRQAILALETKWTVKNIDMEADLDEIRFRGNEPLLMQVWMNLIDNAIKFDKEEGSIFIRLKESEENVLISVTDNGIGISEDARKRIFDKFYQADTSHKSEGNGLGLALCYRIVVAHHGKIDVENVIGGGCKFTVVLPK